MRWFVVVQETGDGQSEHPAALLLQMSRRSRESESAIHDSQDSCMKTESFESRASIKQGVHSTYEGIAKPFSPSDPPDGYTDGHELWIREDVLLAEPKLYLADARPIIICDESCVQGIRKTGPESDEVLVADQPSTVIKMQTDAKSDEHHA